MLTEAVLEMEGERKMMMEGQREHQSRPVFGWGDLSVSDPAPPCTRQGMTDGLEF